jgi:hypothetical protein
MSGLEEEESDRGGEEGENGSVRESESVQASDLQSGLSVVEGSASERMACGIGPCPGC